MDIDAKQFVTSNGRRVLTDTEKQGIDRVAGVGSSPERKQGHLAAAIFEHCAVLETPAIIYH